ncbi:MAG: nucleotidyltransferase family protein [Oscillospiraceae bacterium]|jgi:predicted nucleotidyltransferase|nr:nucleotidyltransferase family protein [Oscillospiraceae bacterium]
MKTVGIICEYNPLHLGHVAHIEKTGQILGDDIAVICVMSGNFVQRGDFAVFNKHARAKMAILSGADIVIELPTPFVLMSAEGFASAGVYLLDKLGICDYLSFGSESGDIDLLSGAANIIASDNAHIIAKNWLDKGISYASAYQKAADALLGIHADVFKSPNNVLGIEYIKAIGKLNSKIQPITIQRTGGEHDGDFGYSASLLRKKFLSGSVPVELMSDFVAAVCTEEITAGRGPVSYKNAELAILSRLRKLNDYSDLPCATEGLEQRFKRFATTETSVASIVEKVKTKRYTMSRIRRMLMCATLGIKDEDTKLPPPYIRILAMNNVGMKLLKRTDKKAPLPILIKPAAVHKLGDEAVKSFNIEAFATDFYTLAYQKREMRTGAQEWRTSPVIIK